MKYCLNYRHGNDSLMDAVDELTIIYNKQDVTLPDFINKVGDKRINISINDLEDFIETDELKKIISIKEAYASANIYLKLPYVDIDFIDILKNNNIKFFVNLFATSFDQLNGLAKIGVSDIYVAEDLCFELDKCRAIADKYNINLRAFPNIAQSSWRWTQGLKKFFIRPEDIEVYGKYIDTIEFICDIDKEPVLYTIYAQDKQWFGRLNEIIVGLDSDIDSRCIVPHFAELRTKCGKKCQKNGNCNICDQIYNLSKTLEDKDLYFIKNKEMQTEEEEIDNIKKL